MKAQWLRHPRTLQEKKENQDSWGRDKRKPKRLPDLYDDIKKAVQRCWKKYRKTQYRQET